MGWKLYSVQLDPAADRPQESAAIIPDGFNIWAFVFGALWALYHRMWLFALCWLMLSVGSQYAARHWVHLAEPSRSILQLGLGLMLAFSANDLRRHALACKGWVLSDIVAATGPIDAFRRYFERHAVAA